MFNPPKQDFIDMRHSFSKSGVPPNSVLFGGTVPPNSFPLSVFRRKKKTFMNLFSLLLRYNKYRNYTFFMRHPLILHNNCKIIEIGKNVKNSDPPPSSQSSLHLKCRLFWFLIWPPPPPYGLFPQFVRFFFWNAPLRMLHQIWRHTW